MSSKAAARETRMRRRSAIDLTVRRRVLELLRRHGWNTTSFQVLEPDFAYWFDGDDACVAYVDTGACWVAAGGPLAPEERLGDVAAAFVQAAERSGRRVAFFAVEQRLLDALPLASLQVGEQPVWDPRLWIERQRGHRSLREQVRRARAKGVAVTRAEAADVASGEPLRIAIERLIDRWLGSKTMPALAFLVELHPFVFAEERRYYVARVEERLVGVLVAVPVYVRDGWFFEDILRDPDAPNGTVEMLIDAAMRDVAAESAEVVTLGLAPLAGEERWLVWMRRTMRGFYNFEGLRAFKAKFRPDAWDTIYLAWPEGRHAPGAVYDVLSAFARGRVFRFAFAAVLRAPSVVLLALAVLLAPWTVLLAVVDSRRWFPSPLVKWGWVAFDVCIASVLFALSRRWHRPLAKMAAAATLLDTGLTAVQAATFNARRRRSWLDVAVIAVSLAAPAVATAILVGGLRTRKDQPRRVAT